MASPTTVFQQLMAGLSSACSGLGYNVQINEGWPSETELEPALSGQRVIAGVADWDFARNATRWWGEISTRTVYPTGIASALSDSVLPGLGSITVTLSGTPAINDAVSLVVNNPTTIVSPNKQYITETLNDAAIYKVPADGMTLAAVAAAFASAINNRAPLNQWVQASALGPVVTVTSLLAGADLPVYSWVGQQTDIQRHLGRTRRRVQISLWHNSAIGVGVIGDAIVQQIFKWQNDALRNGDGTYTMVSFAGDKNNYRDLIKNIWRRDIRLSLEHSITLTDHEYAILAALQSVQMGGF